MKARSAVSLAVGAALLLAGCDPAAKVAEPGYVTVTASIMCTDWQIRHSHGYGLDSCSRNHPDLPCETAQLTE